MHHPKHCPAIACMLGSDYHAWIPNIGYQKVINVLPNLPDFEAETIAAVMENKYLSHWRQLPEDYNYVGQFEEIHCSFQILSCARS
jgi:hypothetical protein